MSVVLDLAFIITLDARERQPNILCVTLIVYVPVAMGNMVVLFEEANTSPAFGAEADQVYTATDCICYT